MLVQGATQRLLGGVSIARGARRACKGRCKLRVELQLFGQIFPKRGQPLAGGGYALAPGLRLQGRIFFVAKHFRLFYSG